MSHVRRHVLVSIVATLLVAAGVEAQETERFSRTVRLGRTGTFDLTNIAGDIVITGNPAEEVRIDAIKRARGRNASDLLRAVAIEVEERAGRVDVRTTYPRRRNLNVSVDFTVRVPRGSTVNVRSISGNINVNDIDGDVRGETVSGNVRASNARVSRLTSASGTVEVRAGSTESDLSVSSTSGPVIIAGIRPRSLTVSSVSGVLRLTDIITERTHANSVTGPIEYSGLLRKGGRYELRSHSGSITLGVQGGGGLELDANSFSGSINTDLPVSTRPTQGGRQRSVRGTVGDGGAVVVLTTFSGNVRVVSTSQSKSEKR